MALSSYIESIQARYSMTLVQATDLITATAGYAQSRLNADGGDLFSIVVSNDEIVMDLVTSDVPGLRHWYISWPVPGGTTTKLGLGMTLSGSNLGKSAPIMNMHTNAVGADPFIYTANDNRVAWTAAGAKEVVAGIERPVSIPTGLPNPEDQQTYESYLKLHNHEHNVAFIDVGTNVHIGDYHGRRVRNAYDMTWPSGLPASVHSIGFGMTVPPARAGRLICSAPIFILHD